MYRGDPVRTVAPTAYPVSIAELQEHLLIDSDTDIVYLEALRDAAVGYVEEVTSRALLTQTWTLKLDTWGRRIMLPRPNLLTVTSITYLDTSGASQTLAAEQYRVLTQGVPGRVEPAYGVTWPSLYQVSEAVTVTYTAGYGATAATVPANIRHAIKLLVSHWYAMREPVVTGTIVSSVPMTIGSLLAPFKIWC